MPLERGPVADGQEASTMIARTRVVPLLAAVLAVLTLASSAWASCAWVLWAGASGRPSSDPYLLIIYYPRGAHETRDQCEQARERLEQAKKPDQGGVLLCLPEHRGPARAEGKRAMSRCILSSGTS
jgi:hypothetical protein